MLRPRILDRIQTAVVVEDLHQVVIQTVGIDAAGLTVGTVGGADRH